MGSSEMSLRYYDVIKDVPDYEYYFTVDELNESSERLADEYPDKVKYFDIGTARNGETIKALKIGEGKLNALIYGFVHPNEPVGSMMIEYFSRKLAQDDELRRDLGFTWYLVKCIDPEGARMNEGWFKEKDLVTFAKNWWRWPSDEDIDWIYPIQYKTLKWSKPRPETKILMRIQQEIKFDVIFPLQDIGGGGGALFNVSDICPSLYGAYHELAKYHNYPLHTVGGSSVSHYYVYLDKGVYIHPNTKMVYDWLENREKFLKAGNTCPPIGVYIPEVDDPAKLISGGGTVFDYARTINPKVFLHTPEVCRGNYHDNDPKYYSDEESDVTLKDVSIHIFDIREEVYKSINETYKKAKKYIRGKSKFNQRIKSYLENTPKEISLGKEQAKKDPYLKKPAKICEKYMYLETIVSLIYEFGMLYQLLNDENNPRLEVLKDEAEQKIISWKKKIDKECDYEFIPIKTNVSLIVGACLATCDYVREKCMNF